MSVKYTLIVAMMLIVAVCIFASFSPQAKAAGNVTVSHYGYFEPIFGVYYVIGEVKNVGGTPVTNVTITVNFYNALDAFINSSETYIPPGVSGYTNPWVLMPEAKAPFMPIMLFGSQGSESVDHYNVTVSFQECDSIPVGLQLTLDTTYVVGSSLYVNGTVTNTGTSNASWVYVYATAYDATGFAFGYYWCDIQDLAPDGVSVFDISTTNWIVVGTPRQVQNYTISAQSFIYTGTFPVYAAQYTVISDINGVIPEFPSTLTAVLLMIGTTASLILYKKRKT
jgi:hypothetical protein